MDKFLLKKKSKKGSGRHFLAQSGSRQETTFYLRVALGPICMSESRDTSGCSE